jgi:single-stranded-DNA-specific exonuclease
MIEATERDVTTPAGRVVEVMSAAKAGAPVEVRGLTMLWKRRDMAGVAVGAGVAGSMDSRGQVHLVERVLRARGIAEPAAADRFLQPKLTHLHDPSLIPDLDRAAARLLEAARGGERIAIYGDYDVDGITASAILFHVLKAVAPAADIVTYVPHRIDEGYGLNDEAIRELAAAGARVIVSVDCGVTAVGPARVARECGVNLIITDHHNPPATLAELPEAFAVVHPRRPDSKYPFGELCGAGVAFKVAWRIATLAASGPKVPEAVRAVLMDMLGLAGLGTIADVVPLVDENRAIASFGLVRVRTTSVEGLKALVDASGLADEKISAMDAGFKIGPRLNACGRMGHAREAVELLTTAKGPRAREIAAQLTELNDQRRETERAIFRQACERAEAAGMTSPDSRAIVLADPAWHAGVVGIVCSRLVEKYHRPAILMAQGPDHCHGSGRSVDGFSLHAGLEACASHLMQFGGHDMAAGLRVENARLEEFTRAFVEHANTRITPEDLVGRLGYDCDAAAHELDVATVDGLSRIGPFGRSNPQVQLRLTQLRIAALPTTFGKMNAHLGIQVEAGWGVGGRGREGGASGGGRTPPLRLVLWKWGHRAAEFKRGMMLEAIATPVISEWSGSRRVEAHVSDLRVLGG